MFISGKMVIICLDFEGVLIPEIWKSLAGFTKINELNLTTRDVSDYDELMNHRLNICRKHNLTLKHIHQVVEKMEPLDGAFEFLSWLRRSNEVIILSDTFREFVQPFLSKLQYPTLFCHSLKGRGGNKGLRLLEAYDLTDESDRKRMLVNFKNFHHKNNLDKQDIEQFITQRKLERVVDFLKNFD